VCIPLDKDYTIHLVYKKRNFNIFTGLVVQQFSFVMLLCKMSEDINPFIFSSVIIDSLTVREVFPNLRPRPSPVT
jgi:hypothetical protein